MMRYTYRLIVAVAVAVLVLTLQATNLPGFGGTGEAMAQSTPATADAAATPTGEKPAPAAAGRSMFAGRPAAEKAPPQTAPAGPLTAAWRVLLQTQQQLHQRLGKAVRDFKSRDPLGAAMALILLSFGYGVFHAAGPGHGKAIISSYVLANERTVRRGIFLSFLAAGIQGLSALVLVGIMVLVLNSTGMAIKSTEAWIETLSWALVALIGIWLLYGQGKLIWLSRRQTAAAPSVAATPVARGAHDDHHAHDASCGHDHGHCRGHGHGASHDHAHDHASAIRLATKPKLTGASAVTLAPAAAQEHAHIHHRHAPTDHAHHAHSHTHDGACCDHAHMPSPDQLGGDLSWRKALAIAFSVGIRPCTGAILVLILAISQGMWWVGVLSTFAMAVGTAITVSVLAALAVGSREMATRFAGRESRWGWRIERTAGVLGGMLVFVMGTAFFFASLQPQSPF